MSAVSKPKVALVVGSVVILAFLSSAYSQIGSSCVLVLPEGDAVMTVKANMYSSCNTIRDYPSFLNIELAWQNGQVSRYDAYCADISKEIRDIRHFDCSYKVHLYSSLDPMLGQKVPGVQNIPWSRVNYLLNRYPAAHWLELQSAVWTLVHGCRFEDGNTGIFTCPPVFPYNFPYGNESADPATWGCPGLIDIGKVIEMATDANANGDGFIPGNGDLVAVLAEPFDATGSQCGNPPYQPLFIPVRMCPCEASGSVSSEFDGARIGSGRYVWFNSNVKVTGLDPTVISVIDFKRSQILLNGATVIVPDARIVFDPAAEYSVSRWQGGQWVTTVPAGSGDDVFLSGVVYPTGSGLRGGIRGANWSGEFYSSTPGLSVSWRWSAAVYSRMPSYPDTSLFDYNSLAVKPTHDSAGNVNSYSAGTPQALRKYAVAGARGGAGAKLTGSWSGTQSVRFECAH